MTSDSLRSQTVMEKQYDYFQEMSGAADNRLSLSAVLLWLGLTYASNQKDQIACTVYGHRKLPESNWDYLRKHVNFCIPDVLKLDHLLGRRSKHPFGEGKKEPSKFWHGSRQIGRCRISFLTMWDTFGGFFTFFPGTDLWILIKTSEAYLWDWYLWVCAIMWCSLIEFKGNVEPWWT